MPQPIIETTPRPRGPRLPLSLSSLLRPVTPICICNKWEMTQLLQITNTNKGHAPLQSGEKEKGADADRLLLLLRTVTVTVTVVAVVGVPT